MVPGERDEILVDLSGDAVGSTLDLQAFNGPGSGLAFGFAGYENATSGEFGSLLNYRTFDVLHVNVAAARSGGVTALPATLVSSTYPGVGDVSRSRTVNITAAGPGTPFTFDGLGFDMNRIDQSVTAGATESWTITAGTIFSHSFHIHGVQFRILDGLLMREAPVRPSAPGSSPARRARSSGSCPRRSGGWPSRTR